VTVNDDRATIPPWGINGGRHGGCSTKTLIRATGEVVELPSKIDQVPVVAGDSLVFRTAGAGGWGDPFDRDPELVLRDVLRDLVSPESARRDYGVVVDGTAVDPAATGAERARLWEWWRVLDPGLDGGARRRPGETAVVVLQRAAPRALPLRMHAETPRSPWHVLRLPRGTRRGSASGRSCSPVGRCPR
jgi:hypothetical protein